MFQAVAQAYPVGDKPAAGFDQQLELTGDRLIGLPGFEPVAMLNQNLQE